MHCLFFRGKRTVLTATAGKVPFSCFDHLHGDGRMIFPNIPAPTGKAATGVENLCCGADLDKGRLGGLFAHGVVLRARYRRIFSAADRALPVLGRPRPRLGVTEIPGLLVTAGGLLVTLSDRRFFAGAAAHGWRDQWRLPQRGHLGASMIIISSKRAEHRVVGRHQAPLKDKGEP